MTAEHDPRPSVDQHRLYATDPDWLEQQYGLPLLRSLLGDPDVVGLTRLVVLDSFEPERIVTCQFRTAEVAISVVEGATSLWWSMPRRFHDGDAGGVPVTAAGPPFIADRASRSQGKLVARSVPPPFHEWGVLQATVTQAPSCRQECLDGVGYRHRLCSRQGEMYAEWMNPDEKEHSAQIALLRQYRRLAESAGIRVPFLPARKRWRLF